MIDRSELSKPNRLFLSNTRKRVGKAVHKYNIIEEGDKVLLAISGGKDSLFLLDSLALQRKHFPIKFKLEAIHIRVTDKPYSIDLDFLEKICANYDIPLHYREIATGDLEESKKSPCFICSWKRRTALFLAMEELECNKLALGHHMDDAIETLLMNMSSHGNISSMPPKLSMFSGKFEIIRPLLLVEERNIIKYAELCQFPDELELCPFEEKGNRFEMKKIISSLEQLNENVRVNLLRSMGNIDLDYLVQK